MHIALWVGLRIFLLPALLLGGALLFENTAGAASPEGSAVDAAGSMLSEIATGGTMTRAFGQIQALMGGVGGAGSTSGCNTYGFGCAVTHNPGAKFLRP